MEHFKKAPFFLDDKDLTWVKTTLASMTEDEKLAQLFCLIAYGNDDKAVQTLSDFQPGGVMARPMPLAENNELIRRLQEKAKVPLLIAANLEKGGNGLVAEGTFLGSPTQVAATNEDQMGRKLGEVCGAEGAAAGGNWAFAPIIDIDYNFRNPITNTRTFGSDPDRVRRMGVEYVKAVQKHGVAASIKHFPGDGVDERDQHLVVTNNDLSADEWDKTYGMVYRACIEAGAKSVMVGHIRQPAWSKKLNPALKDSDLLPATLAPELVTGLLKGHLGFKGLVVTDASTMAGMVVPMDRSRVVPQAIAAGCDMFLFTRSMDEDFRFMKEGLANGILTRARLDEAVTTILAFKASLQLPAKKAAGTLVPSVSEALNVLGNKDHRAWASECADKSVTLVKEQPGVLPLDPKKHKRVLYHVITSGQGFNYSVDTSVPMKFKGLLEKEGFEITVFEPFPGMEGMMIPFSETTQKYDLIVYLANLATKSNQTTVRIEWAQPMGANVPMYGESVPTVFVSVENPYHLLDVPQVKTFINAYASTEPTLQAILEKLMGRSAFKGVSPVDPFCGKWDAKL